MTEKDSEKKPQHYIPVTGVSTLLSQIEKTAYPEYIYNCNGTPIGRIQMEIAGVKFFSEEEIEATIEKLKQEDHRFYESLQEDKDFKEGLDRVEEKHHSKPEKPTFLPESLKEEMPSAQDFLSGVRKKPIKKALTPPDEIIINTNPIRPEKMVMPSEPKRRHRRLVLKPSKKGIVKFGHNTYNWSNHSLYHGTKKIFLGSAQKNVLEFFLSTPNEYMDIKTIGNKTGSGGKLGPEGAIWTLRKKIEIDSQMPVYLRNVRGKGYIFCLEKEEENV